MAGVALVFWVSGAAAVARPRLGIALSGGGARGLAHVGVLRYLEDNCIPVDAVAGTSMGGLIGGLYAMGLDGEELRDLVREIDWDRMSLPRAPYRDLSYRRKEDARYLGSGFELGLKHGVALPSGLSAGPEITLLLDRLTLAYGGLEDFDRLPTPLRITATDMLEGVPVVLDGGSLPEAMRAGLSIPGVFTPVDLDGRLLADGGLLDNLPVEVARRMGAERVIAVDAGTPLLKREQLGSVLGLLDQTIGVMMMESIRRNRAAADVLLIPDLGRYSNQSFRRLEALDALGYQAASLAAEELAPYAVDEPQWQEWLAARRERRRRSYSRPERLRFQAADGDEVRAVRERLEPLVGPDFAVEPLEAELRRILGEGRYERLSYEIEPDGTGGVLVVRAEEKQHGPPFLKLGIELSNARPDSLNATLAARLTVLDLGVLDGEWRTDAAIGARQELRGEIYRPLGGSRLFIAPRAYFDDRDQDVYEGDDRTAIWALRRAGGGADLGLAMSHNSEARVGVDLRHFSSRYTAGTPEEPPPDGAELVVSARLALDRADAPLLPTRGGRAALSAEWWLDGPGLAQDRLRFEGSFERVLRISWRNSLLVAGSAGSGFGGDLPLQLDFTLGGPFRLSAYGLDQFRGDHYVYASAGWLRRLASLPFFLSGGRVYGLGQVEGGSAFDGSATDARYRACLTGALLVESKLATVTGGVSVAQDRATNWFFALGPRF